MSDAVTFPGPGLRAAMARIEGLDGVSVHVGFTGRSALEAKQSRDANGRVEVTKSPARVVDVATFHEFGTRNMPPRPFMRPAVRDNRAAIRGMLRKGAKAVASSTKTPRQVADKVGVFMAAKIQKAIRDVQSPPLAESTRAARFAKTGDANPNPLIDTGQMIQSVTHEVRGSASTVTGGPT